MLCSRVGRDRPLLMNTKHKTRYDCNLNEGPASLDVGAQRYERKMFNFHWCLLPFHPFPSVVEFFPIICEEFFITLLLSRSSNWKKHRRDKAFETLSISLTALEKSFSKSSLTTLQVQKMSIGLYDSWQALPTFESALVCRSFMILWTPMEFSTFAATFQHFVVQSNKKCNNSITWRSTKYSRAECFCLRVALFCFRIALFYFCDVMQWNCTFSLRFLRADPKKASPNRFLTTANNREHRGEAKIIKKNNKRDENFYILRKWKIKKKKW